MIGLCRGVQRWYATTAALPRALPHIWTAIETHGDRRALTCPKTRRSLTFNKLRSLSGNMAAWLLENTRKGQLVATALPNSAEMAITALAALEAGVPLAPLNPHSTPEEIAGFLKISDPGWIITPSLKIHDILEAMKLANSTHTGIIATDDEIVFNGVRPIEDLLQTSGDFERRDDSPAFVFTRSDEVVNLCLRNVEAHIDQVSSDEVSPIEPGDKIAGTWPMFNFYGLTSLLSALRRGGEVVTIQNVSLKEVLKIVDEDSVQVLPVISAGAEYLVDSVGTLGNVKSIIIGGKPTKATEQLRRLFDGEILNNYGPAEGPIIFHEKRGVSIREGSVGPVLPGTGVKVLAKGGTELPTMTEGEIWVKGPQIGDGNQFSRVGVLGYFDYNGSFFVTREKAVTVNGLCVVPSELEKVLKTHSAVLEAAVFPSEKGLVAAVVPADPFSPPLPKEICVHAASRLSPHKHISNIIFMSSLPRTSSGLVDKKRLSSNYTPLREEMFSFNFV